MNEMDLLAAARPASLDAVPDPARRARDLTRAMTSGEAGRAAGTRGQQRAGRPWRSPVPVAIGGGIAAALAGALVAAAVVPGAAPWQAGTHQSGSGAADVQTASYVISRASQALDAIPAGTITVDQSTWNGAYTATVFSERVGKRTAQYTQAGQPEFVNGTAYSSTKSESIFIDYPHKTWSDKVGPPLSPPSSNPAPAYPQACSDELGLSDDASEMAAILRFFVSCGELKAAGTATIDGVTAIKLVNVSHDRGGTVTQTYWVNGTTYLPVRVTFTSPRGSGMQADLQWLPPTPANLARLDLPVPPSGFTHVPWPKGS